MLKFFRNIRKKLIEQEHVRKYILYAVGEILLVVIGILIALQINNWNQERQEQQQLEASLLLMQLNLKEDIKKLEDQIAYNESIQKHIDTFFKMVANPEGTKHIPLNDIGDVAREKSFYSVTTALRSMESGGHFKWITDDTLLEAIYTYYADTERFSKMVEDHNQFARDYVEAFAYKNWDLADYVSGINPYLEKRTARIDNRKVVLENVEFESIVVGRKLKTNEEIGWAKEAKERAKTLHETIESYLNHMNKAQHQ
ncbi:DUF6090 family protein [Croceiramulus getboli]|nr:DUF6090 family protein [Flavobacteriaceae bacterium YJPT1-3]